MQAVATIARRLDGLPLATELAAARTSAIAPSELATMLGDRFDVLAHGSRVVVARHATLHALLEWSYALLDARERRALRALGTFAGYFTRADARAVCDVDEATLFGLAAKSLVARDGDGSRFHLYESIAAFASRACEAAGERDALTERHARFLIATDPKPNRGLEADAAVIDLLAERSADFERCIAWALDRPAQVDVAADLLLTLVPLWYARGTPLRGIADLERLAGRLAPEREARRLVALAYMNRTAYGHAEAARLARAALDLASAIGDDVVRCDALTILAGSAARSTVSSAQDRPKLEAWSREAIRLARRLGDDVREAEAVAAAAQVAYRFDAETALALYENAYRLFHASGRALRSEMCRIATVMILTALGRCEEARELGRRCVAALGNAGNPLYRAFAFANLAEAESACGDVDAATVHVRRALQLYVELRQWRFVDITLHSIAVLFERRGRARDAATLLGYVLEGVARGTVPRSEREAEADRRLADALAHVLGESTSRALLGAGGRLSRDEALALALSLPPAGRNVAV